MNADIRKRFSKAKLLEAYGDMEVPVGSAATTYLGISQERLGTMKLRDVRSSVFLSFAVTFWIALARASVNHIRGISFPFECGSTVY